MRLRTCLAAGVLGISAIVGVATVVAAQDLTPAPSPFGPAPQQPPLFGPGSLLQKPQEQMARALALARAQADRTRVVCGMTVIAPPNVDPESIRKPPDDKNYTMRVVPPAVCGSASVEKP